MKTFAHLIKYMRTGILHDCVLARAGKARHVDRDQKLYIML